MAEQSRRGIYASRIEQTIGWLLRDMRAGDGFTSSIDADSEGEEGRYYLWTEPEIDAALAGTFSQRFKQFYNVSRAGNFQGRNILHRLGMSNLALTEADEALLKKQREMLLEVRNKRVAPMRDDKVLTDWNGMAVAAFARARRRVPPRRLAQGGDQDVRLHREVAGRRRPALSLAERRQAPATSAFADDYAQMARAAYALFEATGDKRYLEYAKKWVDVLNTHFWDKEKGGYYFSADDDEPLMMRWRMAADQSTPAANGIMVGVLAHLHLATGEKHYRDRSNGLLQAFSGELGNRYASYGAYLNGLDTVASGLQIVIVGPRGNAKTQELISAVNGRSLPMNTLIVVDPEEKFAETHPAFGKSMQGGVPTAYVCQQQNCSAPITSPVALSQMLQLPVQAVAGRA